MDDVVAEQDRDAEPRLLDGDALQAVDLDRVGDEEQRAGAAGSHLGGDALGFLGGALEIEVLRELPGLLLDGHLRQERIDTRAHDVVAQRSNCHSFLPGSAR